MENLVCEQCGGKNIQILAWINPRTQEFVSTVNTPLEREDCRCVDCEEHVSLITEEEFLIKSKFVKIKSNLK
jgi:hypothetical protein